MAYEIICLGNEHNQQYVSLFFPQKLKMRILPPDVSHSTRAHVLRPRMPTRESAKVSVILGYG